MKEQIVIQEPLTLFEKKALKAEQEELRALRTSSDAMEFIAEQVNAGRAVLFSPRLQDSPSFPYEVFIDNRLWMGDTLAEAIANAARDVENDTEEAT